MKNDAVTKDNYIRRLVPTICNELRMSPEVTEEITKEKLDKYVNSDLGSHEIAVLIVDEIVNKRMELIKARIIKVLYDCKEQYSCLKDKSLDELVNKANSMYLSSKMTEDEIEADIRNKIQKKQEEFDREKEIPSEPITEPATEVITEPVVEPVVVPVIEPVTEPITQPITQPVTEPIINEINNDLTSMLNDKPAEPIKQIDVNKKLVKQNDNKESQSGSISVFNIGLAILVITTMILVAMTLNVILK